MESGGQHELFFEIIEEQLFICIVLDLQASDLEIEHRVYWTIPNDCSNEIIVVLKDGKVSFPRPYQLHEDFVPVLCSLRKVKARGEVGGQV